MTRDELRALAYALDDEDFEFRDSPMQVRRKWADYLRAQADAQPVATLTLLDDMGVQIDFRKSFTLLPGQTFFLYSHPAPAVPAGWKLVPVEPTGLMVDAGREAMQHAPDLGGIVSANTAEVMDSYTAMLAAAPAVPHHAMLDSHRRLVEQEKANGIR